MAKILYGVCGQGFGHSSRAKPIIEHLEKKGHKIKVVTYDRGLIALGKSFDVEEIFGLRIVYERNKVKYFETLFKNLAGFPEAGKSVEKVLKLIKKFKPQIVFTDFEPISCLAANLKKIPVISIDNQHFYTNAKVDYPKEYKKEALLAKFFTSRMTPGAKAYLAITFFKAKPRDKKTFLFPPIVREEVLAKKPTVGKYIVVYVTSRFNVLENALKDINYKFICYGFKREARKGNLIFKKTSHKEFLKDLAGCSGVVANAGFSLISEALHLGKPYLAWSVKGQFEQILNALYLEKLGYGKHWDQLSREKVEAFIFNLDTCRKNLKKYPRQGNQKIFAKIDELIKKYVK